MKDLTDLVIIIDRSGSMHGLEKDVVGGFNSLIEDQKKIGETEVTTVFFNDKISFVHESVNIKEITELNQSAYRPSGCTSLLDAIGDAITYIKAKHANLKEDELPSHTIFSIVTDGMENSSKEYSYSKIKEMITFQKKCGWEFIFQAANIDYEYEAENLGIDKGMTMGFVASREGVARMMKNTSAKVKNLRSSIKNK